jgi:hypothetical protein
MKRNLKNELLSIIKLEIGEQFFNLEALFPEENAKISKKKTSQKGNKREVSPIPKIITSFDELGKQRVRVPFYFYKLKSPAIGLSITTTFEGKHRLTIASKSSQHPFLFEDFEIIKKLI